MKNIIALLFIAGSSITITAQTAHQDLKDAIRVTNNWDEKIVLFDSLVNRAYKDGTDEYISSLKWITDQAEQAEKYDIAADFIIELSDAYYDNGRSSDTVLVLLNKAIGWKDRIARGKQGDLILVKARAHMAKSQKDSALYYYILSSQVFDELGDSTQVNFGKSSLLGAGIAMDLGKFTKASQLLEKARLIYEHQKDTKYLFYTINDVANLYSMNGFLEKAAEQREMIIDKADPNLNLGLVLITYMNYSNEARKLGNDSLELALLQKSITLVDSTSSQLMQYHYVALCKLINAYSRRGLNDQAIQYFTVMQQLEPRFRESDWLKVFYLRGKAEALYCSGRYDEAIKAAEEIKLDAIDNNEMETVMDMDRVLQRIYLAKLDYKNAYSHFENYVTIKDSISNIEKSNAILYLETQYEDERKKRLITRQEGEIKLLATTNQFQTRLVWVVAIGLVFLFGTIYLYRSRKYALESRTMQEKFSQQLIASYEDERKRISRDLHDSVGQSLMLIKNKIVLDQDETTINMVSQALEEVRTISKALHPVLLEKLGLTASIEKLIHEFDEHTEVFFTEEIDNIDGVFSKEQDLQIFRIAQETLNNMIKHSKTSSALVKVSNEPTKVTLLIKDYGTGFDLTNQAESTQSLGMKTLKERTQILGGKLIIDTVKNQGTTVHLVLSK